jgi:UDP-N-acetylglucosamine--N-acetylmuramyl-(pentapeptide) pyrophosphoryl-undecaprenol N-acetylglucosamine transferase
MKIVFTGGGTGGHFYPIIAVVEKVNQIIDQENIIGAKLYYFSDSPYDKELLFENGLNFEKVISGKMPVGGSILGIFSKFTNAIKIFFGTINAAFKLFTIYPDVVFGKGGYASFPTILAAKLLGIPVIIHESDSAPGRVNRWAGKFAKKVAISFKEAATFFKADKVAWTGQPIRTEIEQKELREKALKYFKIEEDIKIILVLGGSQGAELINNTVLDALPKLTEKYQVIHQTGVNNFKSVTGEAEVVLSKSSNKARYLPYAFLSPLLIKMASGAADIVISRAGSTIFEIAAWGVPSILVPFTVSNADHAKKNAFIYAKAGACHVVEENNMTANILDSEIERILSNPELYSRMAHSAQAFAKPGAAEKIARAIISLALSHEK